MLVINELLGNREVQDKRIGLPEMQVCLTMLRDTPLNAIALGVLEHLCECNGVAVESNQLLLVDHLLKDGGAVRPDVITPIGLADQAPIPLAMNTDILVAIFPLVDGGFEFLFPGDSVPRPLAKCSGDEIQYLTAQLNLLAAIGSHRMYIAIELLTRSLPFRNIQAQLASDIYARRPETCMLRSAFVRVVTALYVDAAPQIADVGPGFEVSSTFVWSQVVAPEEMRLPNPEPEQVRTVVDNCEHWCPPQSNHHAPQPPILPAYEPPKIAEFLPLQRVISDELALVQMSTFTSNILSLMWNLLDFHFYNANFSMLQGAVSALVNAVDVQANSEDDGEADDAVGKVLVTLGVCSKVRVKLDETLLNRKWVLRILDSIPAMLFILGLVFAAITVMLEQGDSTHPGYLIFEYVTFVIFASELIARMIAVGNLKTFFYDPFWVIDFVVVMLDLLMLSGLASSLGGQTKALRTIRMLRLIRAFRMVKLAIKIREEMRRPKAVTAWSLQDRFVHSSKARINGLTGMLDVLLRIDSILSKHRCTTPTTHNSCFFSLLTHYIRLQVYHAHRFVEADAHACGIGECRSYLIAPSFRGYQPEGYANCRGGQCHIAAYGGGVGSRSECTWRVTELRRDRFD